MQHLQPGDVELPDAPRDGISSLKFSATNPDLLLCASWDKSVRFYNTDTNTMLGSHSHHTTPVLDAAFNAQSDAIFSAGLDCNLIKHDIESGQTVSVNSDVHTVAIKSVEYADMHSLALTGGWDKKLCMWDDRQKCGLVHSIELPGKVYAMSASKDMLTVAMSDRHVNVYDLRHLPAPYQRRESALKFQTRCIRTFPSAHGYVISSIEGRVAVEYFDTDHAAQSKTYAFKCHRQNIQGSDYVYPVHALAFHPLHEMSFATGGADGVVSVWDGANKKRLRQFNKYSSSVAALSFSADGKKLAIASSYCFEHGEKSSSEQQDPDSIFVKTISETDVRPKNVK